MSMQNGKQRAISHGLVGGAKFIHQLPRADRALVLASLLQEGPAKRECEIKYALYAFKDAVGKDDPFRAFKIFEKHGLGASGRAEQIRALISAKIGALKIEGKSERADSFAIVFFKDEDAVSRFSERIAESLTLAKERMDKGDPPSAYVYLTGIIEAESKLGLSIHTHESALMLATNYLGSKNFKKAEENIVSALESGILYADERSALITEIGNFMAVVSEGHLREVADIARKNPAVLSLCEEAVSARISESFKGSDNIDKLERDFGLAYAFQMHEEVTKFGKWISALLLGKADAQPEKFYRDYLRAARIAGKAGAHETMDECISKFFALCEELGKDSPSVYAEGSEAAQEFSFWDQANSLGEKAFFGFLSNGEYGKAQEFAARMAFGSSTVWEMEVLLHRLEHVMKRLV
jgi:hypothetical protein